MAGLVDGSIPATADTGQNPNENSKVPVSRSNVNVSSLRTIGGSPTGTGSKLNENVSVTVSGVYGEVAGR